MVVVKPLVLKVLVQVFVQYFEPVLVLHLLVFVKFVQLYPLPLLQLVVVVKDYLVVVENFLLVVFHLLVESHLRLNHLVTAATGQTRAVDLIDDVMAWNIFQLFQNICSQLPEAATTVFTGLTGGDGLLDPLKPLWERLAFARGARRLWDVCLGRRLALTITFSLCGLLDLQLFEDQFQRQLRAAFRL